MEKSSLSEPITGRLQRGRTYLVILCIPVIYYLLPWIPPVIPGGSIVTDSLSFPELIPHCAHLSPISASSYRTRQNTLARTLFDIGASAYIAEPSASAAYYLNVSETQWKLSERPLLFVITPHIANLSTPEQQVQAKITILTPKFEATRAKLLPIPLLPDPSTASINHIHYIEWAEEEDPYSVLFTSLDLDPSLSGAHKEIADRSSTTVFTDGATRLFVADGLQRALGSRGVVKTAPEEVTVLRERKTAQEIELLKCANEATVLAIRATHKRMHVGMRESEARNMVAQALRATGLESGGCLTLFGENAALPHGSGTDRILRKEDFALFDCTGKLHGYWSDVTRTVALPDSNIPQEHLTIWQHVHTAQIIALLTAHAGALTSHPDAAARGFLTSVGFGQWFTHRLGHGIGLEVHESPYLRGGNQSVLIQSGHTFSNEPGVYIEDKVGVRLEDCFYIEEEHGFARFLTAGVGGPAQSPLEP